MTNNQEFIKQKIKEFVHKYYLNKLLRGALLFIIITLMVFITYTLLEYFSYFNTTVRSILFYSYLAVFAATFVFYVAIPLLKIFGIGKQLTATQIASIIGKHFPEIDDKLLNLFQLEAMKEAGDCKSAELLSAAIDTKIEKIKPFPFVKAINFQHTRKYAKWALIPVLLFVVIFSVRSEIFTQSTERIVNHDKFYVKPAPYSFTVQNKKLSTFQNEDFVLNVKVNGKETPNAVYIELGNRKYQMSKNDNIHFSYTFKNLQSDTKFHIYTDEVTTPEYTLSVLPKPVIVSFAMTLHYPAYLHKNDETIDNNGDATIPDGTQITWSFYTRNTDRLQFIINDEKESVKPEKGIFKISKIARCSFGYAVANNNQFCISTDTLKHNINIVPDQYPDISVISQADSVLPDRIYFKGTIHDDYGFSKVQFVYSKYDKDNNLLEANKVQNINVNSSLTVQDFYHYFDAGTLMLDPGQHIDYFFQVFDNDGVNGPKSARSTTETYRVMTEEEIDKQLENSNSQAKNDLQEMAQDSKDLLKEIDKLQQQMMQNKEMTWQDKKKLEELTQQYEELKKQIDEMKKSQDQQDMMEDKYKNIPENLIKKQKELEERFNNVLSDEIKEMYEKLQKMMDQLNEKNNKEDAKKAVQEVKQNTEELNKALDQQLELFKQLEFEKKYNDIIDKTKKLSEEQKALSKLSEQKAIDKEELLKKQQDIEKQYNELKKDLNDLEKLNQGLEDPNKLANTKDLQKQIEQDFKDSKDALSKNNRNKAAGSQQDAGEKMEEMADKMEDNMLDNEEENLEEDIESLRQILDNLVQISFNQEKNMERLRPLNQHSSQITDITRAQHNLRENMEMIADSLNALARRQSAVKPFINEEVGKINNYIDAAVASLNNGKVQNALAQQQYAMTSMNNLALMLAESMKEVKQKQSECKNCKNKKSGKGSCSNPGGKGKTKTARELQQQLNRQMEALKRSMEQGQKQGEKPNQQGNNGQSMSEQLAKLAAQQEAIRKMMQEYEDALKSQNGVGDKAVEQMIRDMEKTEKELVNRQITAETIKRQKNIETRMLESERAQMQREQDEKRESTEGRDIINPNPPKEWNVDKKTQQQTEMLKSIPANLNYYYKEKVNQYFYNIE
ncbi:MAG: hypothetical protein MJZ49_01185 [Bacteroidales bacterium]|nr:hypothetical protein [Bacteroidales bacterium]